MFRCVCVCVFDVLLYSVRMVWERSREGAEQGGGGAGRGRSREGAEQGGGGAGRGWERDLAIHGNAVMALWASCLCANTLCV